MNVDIGAEAAQFPEKKYINGIAVAVRLLVSFCLLTCAGKTFILLGVNSFELFVMNIRFSNLSGTGGGGGGIEPERIPANLFR
jgi:hypothetical protein